MTPSSSDRARTMSPLDIFGLVPHPPMPAAQPLQAFEAVLNNATMPGKTAFHRQPAERTSAERPAKEPDAHADSAAEKSTGAARKKQQAKAAPSSGPHRKAADEKSTDESREDSPTAPPASDSSQSTPQPQEAPEAQDETGEAGTQVDPTSAEGLIDQGDAAPQIVSIAEQILIAPLPPISPGETHPPASAGPRDEGTQQVTKAELNPTQPALLRDEAIPPSEYAAPIPGNGPLSRAEPGQDSPAAADPVTLIDGQMATEEIQPAEPVGNSGEKQDGSRENEEPPRKLEDVAPPALPDIEAHRSQEVQNAATAPPPPTDAPSSPTTDAPSSPKDAPPTPQATSQPTTGVQPSPNRLPQHVLTRSEAHQGHNPAPVPVDSARFLSRVAKAFLSAQQRDGEVRLRLSPPELGSLRLQISVQDGVMVARMETETEAARSSLVNNLPALRERLAEQGVRIERFDIDLMQRPPTGTPDRPSDPQQQHEPEPLRLLRTQSAVSEVPKTAAPANNWNGQGRLNVII
ncbi:MAG: flagellar hook-length control protein FliK [Pirellulaceae bacterium]